MDRPNILYKAGVYLELQRFKNRGKRNRGLDFSVAKLRALSALTALLDRNGYRGTEEPLERDHKDFAGMEAPVLSFTWKDYLQLYYGKPGPFKGQQAIVAKEALRGLAGEKVKIAYYRRKGNDPAKHKYIIDDYNLIRLKNESPKTVTVAYHPIFLEHINSFHTWKPVDLHQIVADYLKTKKVKKAIILFLEWLMTKDTLIYKIPKKDLIERLWLIDTFEDMRHKNRVGSTLTQCFETAKGLGFLKSDVIEDDSGNFHFQLNQERCTRISANKKNKPKS